MPSTPEEPGFIPPHGNYRELLSYQKAAWSKTSSGKEEFANE
jgi:hypothetical protein